MIRLFLAFLSALALAFSPVTLVAAATPAAMADCGMMGEMPAKPADQSKMDCCTPACPAPTLAALQPEGIGTGTPLAMQGLEAIAPVAALYSIAPTGLDPPPRLLS